MYHVIFSETGDRLFSFVDGKDTAVYFGRTFSASALAVNALVYDCPDGSYLVDFSSDGEPRHVWPRQYFAQQLDD